jgi:chromosome segregation ATPase
MDTETSAAIDTLGTDVRRMESTLGDRVDDARRHTQVLFESLRDDIRMIAEGVVSIDAKAGALDLKVGSLETKVGVVDMKVTSLEAKVVSLNTKMGSFETKVVSLETVVAALGRSIEHR